MTSTPRTVSLQILIKAIEPKEIRGDFKDVHVSHITQNSRKAGSHRIFVANKGTQVDGHDFIDQAIERGAEVIVLEEYPEVLKDRVCYIRVSNSSKSYALLSAAFYNHPGNFMKMIGITGTNGKTSIASFLYQLYSTLGYKVGLISTIHTKIGAEVRPSTHTTPDAEVLQSLLFEMRAAGCSHVFMEVSSHALIQNRVCGLAFDVAVFTNLTHDHLDYHGSFKAYRDAKKILFDGLSKNATALVNKDDKNGDFMLQNCKAEHQRFGIKNMADFKAVILENSMEGLHLRMDGKEFFTRISGYYNAENLLACYAVARILGEDSEPVIEVLSALSPVEGRMEMVRSPKNEIIGIVDYAHTPDALKKLLSTVKSSMKAGRLITIIGCGGDRDKEKRPIMAGISCDLSDQTILTSDNPRSEDPNSIIEDMLMGVKEDCNASLLNIVDRKQAIRTACRLATRNDVIVIAGKGHENYQEVKGERFPFNDKEIIEKEFELMFHTN